MLTHINDKIEKVLLLYTVGEYVVDDGTFHLVGYLL